MQQFSFDGAYSSPKTSLFIGPYFEVHRFMKPNFKVHRKSALRAIVVHLELFMAQGPDLWWSSRTLCLHTQVWENPRTNLHKRCSIYISCLFIIWKTKLYAERDASPSVIWTQACDRLKVKDDLWRSLFTNHSKHLSVKKMTNYKDGCVLCRRLDDGRVPGFDHGLIKIKIN